MAAVNSFVKQRVLLFASVFLAGGLAVQAGTLVTNSLSGPLASAGSTSTYGMNFFVGATSLQLSALGIWDASADGLFNSHSVGIWTAGGILLDSVTIPAGTSASLLDGYRYVSLASSLTLSPGQEYVIGASYLAGDSDKFINSASAPSGTFAPEIIPQNRRLGGVGFSIPTLTFTGGYYVAPNAIYSVVPEPTTLALCVLASTALLIRLRR